MYSIAIFGCEPPPKIDRPQLHFIVAFTFVHSAATLQLSPPSAKPLNLDKGKLVEALFPLSPLAHDRDTSKQWGAGDRVSGHSSKHGEH